MIIVQKFGGTCLDGKAKRDTACKRIIEALSSGYSVCAVVSAMGRKGEPYATDTLIALAREVNLEVAPRELDLLLSCGEIISAVLMVQELQSRGIQAMALSGGQAGIVTDTNFGDANIIAIDPSHVRRHLEEGKVVVVAGFQGMAQSGDITTLGRGGSDTTAVGLGAALCADHIEIYTDVEGIMTADPRLVADAKTIPIVTYPEVSQLAWEGAKVVHPRAVEIANRAQIPIWIRSMEEGSRKTLVTGNVPSDDPFSPSSFKTSVTAITYRKGLSQVIVDITQDSSELVTWVFELLREVPLDMINLFQDRISIAVSTSSIRFIENLLEPIRESVAVTAGKAKITVVGCGMHGRPGIMDRVVGALWGASVRVYASSDSNTTISCLIDEDFLAVAANALHKGFEL
jgi:aspartate kinase